MEWSLLNLIAEANKPRLVLPVHLVADGTDGYP